MFKIQSSTRLAISVGFTCMSLVWVAMAMNMVPDPQQLQLEHHKSLTRAIAVSVSTFAEGNRLPELRRVIERNVRLEPGIVSIGLRRDRGRDHLLSTEAHELHWDPTGDSVGSNQVAIDIIAKSRKWGQLEIVFQSQAATVGQNGWWAIFAFPNGLILFLTSSLTLITWFMLYKAFRYLNPSKVVPSRVRLALDSIGSGLVLVAPDGEIAHANRAFGKTVKMDVDKIVGTQLDGYEWSCSADGPQELPWHRCQRTKEPVSGDVVESHISDGVTQKFMVNSTPIYGSGNQSRGMLISFEDVTALESKKAELAKIIQTVRMSRDEVERQNEQLSFLASYDPLTKCMNRRSFFPQFEERFSEDGEHPLTILMLDIDHFKSVNDDHGHSTGDEVLKSIGELMNDVAGDKGTVCRFGGEEFAILLADLSLDACCSIAEAIRSGIESEPIAGLNITASLGLSNKSFGAMDPQHMLDQADQCLYVAKRRGRNQVVRFDQCPTGEEAQAEDAHETQDLAQNAVLGDNESKPQTNEFGGGSHEIESASVTGLLSALSLRSLRTAEHSVRVANLAVAIGRTMFDKRELYNMEIAALLHDVGKIGVPDTILNKPGRLTESEWTVMRRHDEIGLAIVRNSFASDTVAETINLHHQKVLKAQTSTIQGDVNESIHSEILFVCDAYDSMVSDQPYRKAMSVEGAIKEILANTPNQFDPVIVNALVAHVASVETQTRGGGNSGGAEFDQLIVLAESVLDLCDSTRATLLATDVAIEGAVVPGGEKTSLTP